MAEARYRILLVEDNPGDAKLIELALRAEPPGEFAVHPEGRAASALEALRGGRFDAAMMDLHLPDADGPDGIGRLRAASAELAIVAMSGSDDAALRAGAFSAGADAFQRKERYPRGALGSLLRTTIEGRQAARRFLSGEPADAALSSRPGALVALDEGAVAGATPAASGLLASGAFSPNSVGATGAAVDGGELWASVVDGPPAGGGVGGERVRATVWRSRAAPTRTLIALWDRAPPSSAPPIPTAAPDAVLDPAAWADLREQAGPDTVFLPQLVRVFREYGAQLMAELGEAEVRSDVPALGRVAHTLRSSAAQVGARPLAEAAGELEQAATRGDRPTAVGLVPRVRAEFERALAALRSGPPRP